MSIITRFTFPSGASFEEALPETLKLEQNFTLKELANNKAVEKVKFVYNIEVAEFLDMVQELRNKIGVMNVNSCFRTKSFNTSCGGSTNSLHLQGLAMDVSFVKMTDSKYNLIKSNWEAICKKYGKIGGINRYTNGVHIDCAEDKLGNKCFKVRDYRKTKSDW